MQRETLPRIVAATALAAAIALTLTPSAQAAPAAPHKSAIEGTNERPAEGSLADARAEAERVRATVDRMQAEIEALTEDYDANRAALDQAIAADLAGRRALEDSDAAVAAAQTQMDERARAAYQRGPISGIEGFLHARDWHEMLEVSVAVDSAAEADRSAIDTLTGQRARAAATGERLAANREGRQRLDAELAAQRTRIEQRVAAMTSYLARVDARVKTLVEQERQRQEAARRAAIARQLAAQAAGAVPAVGWQVGGAAGPVTPATEAQAAQAVSWAMAQMGKPYQWGATGPDTFDCSGLVGRAWAAVGINLPRTSREQFLAGAPVQRLADLRPGDLVFFGATAATIHHVGMYVGDGQMVEAPHTGAVVRLASIGRPDLIGAVRPGA
jgi:cell wall-associated NlpC family hydrolase